MCVRLLHRRFSGLFHGVRAVLRHVTLAIVGSVSLLSGMALCATIVLMPFGVMFVIVGLTSLSMIGQSTRR
ncbi:MAG: hypothetical protein ABGZ17_30915 [Planctomycetaceae bacterium]